jgi:hypothetical protein
MNEQLQKQWIVLLNKTPRGPFSASEIHSLISQKVIRHNDVAYLIPEDNNSERASWKFLWQFDEFDSRKNEKNNPPPAAVLEKRTSKTEAEIVAQVAEQVPLDLQSIRAEDLIVRTASPVRREVAPQRESKQREVASFSQKFERPSIASGSLSALFALVAFVSLGWLGYGKYKDWTANPSREVSSNNDSKEKGTKRAMAPVEKGVPRARNTAAMRPPAPIKPITPPQARDRGEINQEERRRLHQEELRREAEERERAAQQEEKEPEASEEDSGEDSGSKRKKPTRNTADEESTGIEGEVSPAVENPSSGSGEDQPPSSWLEE